ncbi:MAG: rhomboid family intramembrane serine protease [Pseudomonadota bacterium]
MHPSDQSPVNPLPPIVWVLFLAVVVPEALFSLGEAGLLGGAGAIGWRVAAIQDYGFSGIAFDWMLRNGQMPLEHSIRVLTYTYVHQAFTSTLFAAVLLLALGKLVGEVMGQLAVAVVFVFSGVFGALAYGLLTDGQWLIGAFPAVYGLIGCYTFLMWQRFDQMGEGPLRAFSLIGILMGVQILFSLVFGALSWVADLAGFACGLGLSLIVVPGGMGRLRRLVQRR